MSPFLAMPYGVQAGYLIWCSLLICLFVFNMFRYYQRKDAGGYMILSAAFAVVAFGLIQLLLKQKYADWKMGAEVSFLLWCVFAGVLSLIGLFQLYMLRHKSNRRLSGEVLKEAFDSLPTGLLYYWPNGLIKLKNAAMDAFSMKMTGLVLDNAAAFWEALSGGSLAGEGRFLRTGEEPLLVLPDGTAYSFRRNELKVEGHLLYEVLAVEVTDEYRIMNELEEKQAKADQINRRLQDLGADITRMTMEKEVLDAKVRLHDSLGRILLMSRQYLKEPGRVDRDELMMEWQMAAAMLNARQDNLSQPAVEEWLDRKKKQATSMGIRLLTEIELPVDTMTREVMELAVDAHMTNTLRHAEGNMVYLRCEKTADGCVIRLTNNGRQPDAPIKERGGLLNLRRTVEYFNGIMTVSVRPRFELKIELPAGDSEP